jgi:hypothetical protein
VVPFGADFHIFICISYGKILTPMRGNESNNKRIFTLSSVKLKFSIKLLAQLLMILFVTYPDLLQTTSTFFTVLGNSFTSFPTIGPKTSSFSFRQIKSFLKHFPE